MEPWSTNSVKKVTYTCNLLTQQSWFSIKSSLRTSDTVGPKKQIMCEVFAFNQLITNIAFVIHYALHKPLYIIVFIIQYR